MSAAVPSRVPWPPILLIATVAAGWIAQSYLPVPWPMGLNPAALSAGIPLIVLALAIIGWAGLEMNRANTTILPNAAATTLVATGPFHFSRNPIYVADCLVLIGLALVLQKPWIGLLVPAFIGLVTWLAISPEEHHLELTFGQAYRDYKLCTRRWL